MTDKINRLRELQEQKARKTHLESLRSELTKELRQLNDKSIRLRMEMDSEQRDVDRLEKGLVSLFYELTGKKEQKLEKEQREARAARLKYETAKQEIEAVENRLRRNNDELRAIVGCEHEYETLLQELLWEIKASGDSRREEIIATEQQIAEHKEVIREISEAISAGSGVLSAVDTVLHHLDDAAGWGTWDIFGGGLLADIAKHEALDSAQRAVDTLQLKLRSFKTELVDVNVEANVQISLDGFLGFADFFFDGFFADFAVMDHIERATADVKLTKTKVQGIMNTLRTMQAQREAAVREARDRLAAAALG